MSIKRALISGVTGQDGSYLAEFLLTRGYEVHGIVGASRLKIRPGEYYHLAAQSFVSYSFDDEFSKMNVNVNGTHHMLAALKDARPECRSYFAGTSEMFGRAEEEPQSEKTRFLPRSAYGISKVAGFDLTRNYREAYGIHASSGVLFNHESPRRGHEFVTRKISSAVAAIASGNAKQLTLGNLDARRDWGHAKDYVPAMWMMLQQPVPDGYVIATGATHSVREFAELAFDMAGMDYRDYVVSDPRVYRPGEVDLLRGDASKARAILGWSPETGFEDLVTEMVNADCAGLSLQRGGRAVAGSD